MLETVPKSIGDYTVLGEIARGSYGIVYHVKHKDLGREAAIKLLHTISSKEDIQALLREAKLLAKVRSPHVVQVYHLATFGGNPYFVMDYYPKTLAQAYPKGKRVEPAEVCRLVQHMAFGLSAIHELRFAHRDFKPQNVLLDAKGNALVSDCGIVVELYGTNTLANQPQQIFAGTPAYVAPEQITGRASRRSDIYALATVTYKLLSGHLPFEGDARFMLYAHQYVKPKPLTPEEVTPEVAEVIMQSLDKDPRERHPTAQVFAEKLIAAMEEPERRRIAMVAEEESRRRQSLEHELETVRRRLKDYVEKFDQLSSLHRSRSLLWQDMLHIAYRFAEGLGSVADEEEDALWSMLYDVFFEGSDYHRTIRIMESLVDKFLIHREPTLVDSIPREADKEDGSIDIGELPDPPDIDDDIPMGRF